MIRSNRASKLPVGREVNTATNVPSHRGVQGGARSGGTMGVGGEQGAGWEAP